MPTGTLTFPNGRTATIEYEEGTPPEKLKEVMRKAYATAFPDEAGRSPIDQPQQTTTEGEGDSPILASAVQAGTTFGNTAKSLLGLEKRENFSGDAFVMDMVGMPFRVLSTMLSGEEPENGMFPMTAKASKFIANNAKDATEAEKLTGSLVASVADPINLAFVGAGTIAKTAPALQKVEHLVKLGLQRGMPVAVAQNLAYQQAHTGEIDPDEAGLAAVIGTAAPIISEGLLRLGTKVAGAGISKGKEIISKLGTESAESVSKRSQVAGRDLLRVAKEAKANLRAGLNPDRALARAFEKTGVVERRYWDTVFAGADNAPFASTPDELYYEAIDKGFDMGTKAAEKSWTAPFKKSASYDKAAQVYRGLRNRVDTSKPMKHLNNWFARSVSTQLEKKHPGLGRLVRTIEMNRGIGIGDNTHRALRWRQGVLALPDKVQRELGYLLSVGDRHGAKELMKAWENSPKVRKAMDIDRTQLDRWGNKPNKPKTYKELQRELNDPWSGGPVRDAHGTARPRPIGTLSQEFEERVLPLLDETHEQLYMTTPLGAEPLGYEKNFFPRVVKDYKKWLETNTKARQAAISAEDELRKAAARLERPLTDQEEHEIILKYLTKGSGSKPLPPKATTEKARVIHNLSREDFEHYASPAEALERYIYSTQEVIAFLKGLGIGNGGADASQVTSLVRELYSQGELLDEDIKEVSALLLSRMGMGTQQMHDLLRKSKNFFYMTTLANPVAATVQTGDMAVSAVVNGVTPTIKALAQTIKSGNKLPVIDATDTFDLVRPAIELTDNTSMGAWVQRGFHYSGFAGIDKIGKNVNIQSTLNKARSLAMKEDGIEQLQKHFGQGIFSRDEWAGIVKDLRAGKVSENIKFLTWNTLSDSQPISLSEMPKAYLDHPNGRIFYAMKSYMLKQLDLVRKRGLDMLAIPGRQREGMEFLAKYAVFLGAANMAVEDIKSFMLGREIDRGDSRFDDLVWGALKGVGMSQYFTNQVAQAMKSRSAEDLSGALFGIGAFAHIIKFGMDAYTAANPTEEMVDEGDTARRYRIVKFTPGVGTLVHNYFLGGRTAFEEWQEELRDREEDDE